MSARNGTASQAFGGPWTREKLSILQHYLDAYTTALKNQPFRLMYVDAFAGTGRVALPGNDREDLRELIRGSAAIALNIQNKRFDRLIFVEQDSDRCSELEGLKGTHSGQCVEIIRSDANQFLKSLQEDWREWRGVLFLDPFATEVEWETVRRISEFKALDTWILFPVGAIQRMLPTRRLPDEIDPAWAQRLTTVFGGDSWRELYGRSPQGTLFGDEEFGREPGSDGLLRIYKVQLANLFGSRLLEVSRPLRNSRNSVLFELLFCVGNDSPKAIDPAKRIAKHILDHL